ncbi:MAG: deoxyribodipyrimidine photo-lyase [Candidatus Eremiobacteraeota bacterium]|nr:deoxyribodipyrimidine photo-lyase [Candidatus Eremiobacteraeota bacterium]
MSRAFRPSGRTPRRSILWLRRDLRLRDNVALAEAAEASDEVALAFVLDPVLLRSERMGAPLVQAFFSALASLRAELRARGSDLALLEGDFAEQLTAFAGRIGAGALCYNEDYEPGAIERDARVRERLEAAGIAVHASLDHVYFDADEVRTESGAPYRIFTPYKRRWLDQHALAPRMPVRSNRASAQKLLARAEIGATRDLPEPEEYGHHSSAAYPTCSEADAGARLDRFLAEGGASDGYALQRDLPAVDGTSRLSPDLRAGTIGIRTCVARACAAMEGASAKRRASLDVWLSELIWRDFYQQILRNYPHVASAPFLPATAAIPWREDESVFRAWCEARTGYPIVDAAMQQLNTTGWMHNRLRMIVASFLSKDLLLNWQWGERYFERQLADADLAQNNGGWQWAASTGTDAAPYFRIFNPVLQGQRFDPEGAFVRAMLPALRSVPTKYVHAPWQMPPLVQRESGCIIGEDYPAPIVDRTETKTRVLAAFSAALGRA